MKFEDMDLWSGRVTSQALKAAELESICIGGSFDARIENSVSGL